MDPMTAEALALAAELEGFAEGSTSARASLMRDAAATIRALIPEPPTDDEPSRKEYREGYEAWRAEGRRMHAALLDIWRMAEPTDTADRTYGGDPAVVVTAVHALLAPADDEREALALRLMQINPGCDAESAMFYRSQDSGGWRRALSDAADLMASPEWRNRNRSPITDEMVEAATQALSLSHDLMPGAMREALEAAEAAR